MARLSLIELKENTFEMSLFTEFNPNEPCCHLEEHYGHIVTHEMGSYNNGNRVLVELLGTLL